MKTYIVLALAGASALALAACSGSGEQSNAAGVAGNTQDAVSNDVLSGAANNTDTLSETNLSNATL